MIDALDESNSEVIRFDDCARLMRVDRYAFLSDKLKGSVIFKIPQFPTERVFVTNHFVERVKATLLKGFWFPVSFGAPMKGQPLIGSGKL